MKMWMKKFLAFVLMSAMLIGDVTPAFAAEVSNSASVTTGTYTLDENGNLVKTEPEKTVSEEKTNVEVLTEEEETTEKVTTEILSEENIIIENSNILKDNDVEESVVTKTEPEENVSEDTFANGQATEYGNNVVSEETMLETQNEENGVFAVFVENREPQYFNALNDLKDYINTDPDRADIIYNIDIRQSLNLSDTIDFSDVTAKEIRINLCQNTVTINADVTIAVNAISDGNVVVTEGRTLTLLPLYSGEQNRTKMDCWSVKFDFRGYASKLVLGNNAQETSAYTEMHFNDNLFLEADNATLELNGSVFFEGHKANEKLLESKVPEFEENEKLVFAEISVNNDISIPFVQENEEEWYENITIGIPVVTDRLRLNGDLKVYSMDVTGNVDVEGYSRLKYTAETILNNVTIDVAGLEEHQSFELEQEHTFDAEGNLLSEGNLTLKGSLNDGNGRSLIFFNQYSNTISKHIVNEENWWIEENHNWDKSEFHNGDVIVKLIVSDSTTENTPILNTSNYEFNRRQNDLGLEVVKSENESNTYELKVCQYKAAVAVFNRIVEENGNWRSEFIEDIGFSSLQAANAYIKANESEQKIFSIRLTEDTIIEEENKDIFDYSDYKTHVELHLDSYTLNVNEDMTICVYHINGGRYQDTENGPEVVAVSTVSVAEGKTLTILPQDKQQEQDMINVENVKFEFDNSNLVLGSEENRTHVHLEEVDFNTPVKNLTINGSLHYNVPLTEGNGIEVTDTLRVSNFEAEAGLWVPVIVKNLELDGNISVSDFVSTGVVKTDNDNRFNIVADGKAELNDIEVTVNEQNPYSRFIIAMDQNIELVKYGNYTAEQWEEIFANWEDDKEVPEDIYEDINVVSNRGELTINGSVIHDEDHVAPVQLEKYFCWDAVRANNQEEKSQFCYWVEFGKLSENEEGETVAVVSKAEADKFTLSYMNTCLVKKGTELKATNSEVDVMREGTDWFVEYESFEAAVAAIDKRKDNEAYYVILLKGNLGSEEERITLKLPKYAKRVTIASDNFSRIFCKNTISQTTDVRFENVVLSSTANYDAKKYNLEVFGSAFFVNNLTAKTLTTIHSGIEASGKVNVTNLVMLEPQEEGEINNSSITSYKAMNLTDITGKGILEVHNAFTAKAWKKGATQFTLKGDVSSDVTLDLRPIFYDAEGKSYYDFLRPNEEGVFELDWNEFGNQVQDLMVTCNETPASFKKMMTAKKLTSTENILFYGIAHNQMWPIEYKSGIYFTNIPDPLSVSVKKTEDGEVEFLGDFRKWDDMVKHIDSLKQSDWVYFIDVHGNIGADRDTPLKSLTLPSKAKRVYVNGNGEGAIVTSGTKVTLKTDTVFNNILIAAVNKKGESVAFTVNVGKYQLILENIIRELGGEEAGFYYNCDMKLTGAANSVVDVRCLDGYDRFNDAISQISKVSLVILHSAFPNPEIEGSNFEYADYYIENGITGIGELVLDKGVNVDCGEKDFSAKYLTMGTNVDQNTREDMWSSLRAKNITVSDMTVMRNANLKAGTNTVGDGKITLNNMIFLNHSNHIEGKVDKKDNSLVNIKGNVTVESEEVNAGDSVVTISLCENNDADKYVQLTEGMTLLTAPKASSSFFRPDYDVKMEVNGGEDDGDPSNDIPVENERRMGWEEWLVVERQNEDGTTTRDIAPKTGLYNAGNYIKYGTVREISEDNSYFQDTSEVRLWVGITGVNENSWNETLHMDFATFEEAVTAIDKMALLKEGSTKKQKVYETYTLELLNDIEIGNEKGDFKYKTIKLPSKASELYIQGNGRNIKYTGNVTLRCNTTFDWVLFTPLKNSKGKVAPMMSNFVLGNYTLNNLGLDCGYMEEKPDQEYPEFINCLGKISGSAKSSKLILNPMFVLEAESVTGVKTVEFKGNGEDFCYVTYEDENGNTIFEKDDNGNNLIYRSVLYLHKDMKVKEITFSDYTAGRLFAEGNVTTDIIRVDGEVLADIYKVPTKSLKVKGATVVNADNTKTKKSVDFVPYKNEENTDVYSELTLHLLSADGSDITDGMKLLDGKYLNAADWNADVVETETFAPLFELDVTANDKNTILYIKK